MSSTTSPGNHKKTIPFQGVQTTETVKEEAAAVNLALFLSVRVYLFFSLTRKSEEGVFC